MFKKINLMFALMFFVLIGSVSAIDDNAADLDNMSMSADENVVVEEISEDVVLEAGSHTINSGNYKDYFDSNGNLVSASVKDGDTVYLDGKFSNSKFTFNKPVNIVGTSTNDLKNSVVTLLSGASGSSISGLKIANTNDNAFGVFLNSASYCTVENCFINNSGVASHCIAVGNDANHNNITNNFVSCYGITYGHGGTRSTPPLIVSGSHYNTITNNHVECDDANGIYLSSFNHDPLKGGPSDYNVIYNNTVHYNVLPTSWANGIKVMGGNNLISSNKVIGGYKGIYTSSGKNNTIIYNQVINVTGADYNHLGVEVGGEYAIVGTPSSIIANNTITNSKIGGSFAGIYVIDNSIAEYNYVEVLNAGKGIEAGGSNVIIRNNVINTQLGSGVHQKDDGSGLLVENNTITSVSGAGILIEKLSSKRMPSNVTVIKNTISTGNKHAIEASGVQADTSFIDTESNKIIGSGTIVSPAGVFDSSKPTYTFKGTTHYITPENVRDYINFNGGLSPEIKDGDILNFKGNFNNEIIFITKSVKVTGDSPIFYNSSFKITASNVWIENLTIINNMANRVNAWGIFVNQGFGVKIINNTIRVNDPNAAYAIYVLESSSIEVINNDLFSEGTYLTFTLLSYASENCDFSDNIIHTMGTDEVYAYEPKKCLDGAEEYLEGDVFCLDGGHVVPEIYRTYGILMLYSSNNNVTGNDVNVTSRLKDKYPTTGAESSSNSLVGIDLYYNSHNNTFSNNNVFVKGMDNYIYGMGVLGVVTGHAVAEGQGATGNSFIGNAINLEGTYFATGFIAGDSSVGTNVKDNTININSGSVVYGITLEMSQASSIDNNTLNLNSQLIYGIDGIGSSDNVISQNTVTANSKTSCTVLISNGNGNIISKNLINSNGSGEEIPFLILDYISCENSGIYLVANSTGNKIVDNNITSSEGYAVVLDSEATSNVISDNYLSSKRGTGNGAVSASKANDVSDNYKFVAMGSYSPVDVKYMGTGEFKFNFTENANGGIVKLYDTDNNYLNETVISNGKAVLSFSFDKSYDSFQYIFYAKFEKDNFKTSLFQIDVEVFKGDLIIGFDNVTITQGDTKLITAKVSDEFGNPIKGVRVQFSRKTSADTTRSMGIATTDGNGVASLNYTAQTSLGEGVHDIFAEVAEIDNYNGAVNSSKLTVLAKVVVPPTIAGNKDYSVYYGNTIKYKVRILDESGKPLGKGKSVVFTINGKSKSVNTDASGYATYSIKLNAGKYTLSIKCDERTVSSKITFKATLTAKNLVQKKSKTTKFSVKLVDKKGKILKNKKVTFKINGKKYTAKTNKKGTATISIKNLKVGKHTITSSYGGCTIKNTIKIKK
ncbi:right-handed parallel beta-helix repeat-containing protein [uncultured Methanobrevibacter sp.]|uniref:right-handed parallel beta-helix repeat-containing protein n=1 Tax=uncultured Methanobrevibacter sp. TaxID=253161 RepID=UPI0026052EFF|nr:right-handed parallel beta-helix repeat-containing protein [uncultured Methanobrevibacter sp.]